MRGNRRSSRSGSKKERAIMIGSSVFVLAALTMTGLYMRQEDSHSQDDGYVVDFTALEDSTDEKLDELAQNTAPKSSWNSGDAGSGKALEDDLDYMPYDEELDLGTTLVGSGQVEIPGVTEQKKEPEAEEPAEKAPAEDEMGAGAGGEEQLPTIVPEAEVARELHFDGENGLVRPVNGEVLLHYSMDSSVYFKTLDQYTRNPAVVFQADEGTDVSACAAGQVVSVYEDSKIGQAVTLDLGDGYQVTYGQLGDLQVAEGDYVEAGQTLASVSAPTKYYVEEGSNLYFRLTKDGNAVNPEELF